MTGLAVIAGDMKDLVSAESQEGQIMKDLVSAESQEGQIMFLLD